jgi:regulator of protease activity HflC (stomatin/prohibitin superfamily)
VETGTGIVTAAIFILVIGATAIGLWGCPSYNVYSAKMAGEAELAQANFSKQVAVQEAKAKLESASLLAQADVERAKGAAQANVILGNSLKGNEDYLKYLWIQGLESAKSAPQVIYVPTEAGLPILEAGKR